MGFCVALTKKLKINKMNCEPCNSLEVTCNHNVTIGYLKELVAAIPSACCTTITVTGNDSYCPTYGELTGGTLIPNFSDGGNNAWSNNVDGIVINPGYSNNQCVAKKDLKLIYTAFESLVTTNSSPIVSECGGATTTTKALTFRKYTKECNKTATSTTQVDTVLGVTWHGTDGSGTGTKTYPINDSFTDTHASSVYCTISWRGCNYTSNSVAVSQKVREFSHYNDYSMSSGQSVDVSCYPYSFDCKGGTSYASALYYYTTWTERHYIDTCNRDYQQENVNIVKDNTLDVSSNLNATSYTYECQVTTAADSRFTFEATYDGLYDSDSCWQVCSQCADCPPKPFTSYTDVTVACTAGTATVGATAYTFSGGYIDGSGNCVGWTSAGTNVSYTKTWNCSTAGGWIDGHIYVTGAPCCQVTSAYTYDDVVVNCSAASSTLMSVGWTCEVHNADGTTSIIPGTNTNTPIPAVSCNPNSSSREIQSRIIGGTLELSRPLVTQAAGPCCCSCDDLSIGSAPSAWEYNETNVKTVSVSSGSCISMSVSNTTHFNVSLGNGVINISPKGNNTDTTAYTDTVTVVYTANGGSCTNKTFEVKQNPRTCPSTTCVCYLVGNATASTVSSTATSASVTWAYSAITWTTASTCAVSSALTSNGTSSTTVTFAAATCDNYAKSGSFTWTNHKSCGSNGCNSSDITVNWNVTQQRPSDCDCDCGALSLSPTSLTWDWSSTTAKDVTISSSNCVSNISLSNPSNFTATLGSGKITITPNSQNNSGTPRTATLTVTFTSGSHPDCTKTVSLSQDARPCDCGNITITEQT